MGKMYRQPRGVEMHTFGFGRKVRRRERALLGFRFCGPCFFMVFRISVRSKRPQTPGRDPGEPCLPQ